MLFILDILKSCNFNYFVKMLFTTISEVHFTLELRNKWCKSTSRMNSISFNTQLVLIYVILWQIITMSVAIIFFSRLSISKEIALVWKRERERIEYTNCREKSFGYFCSSKSTKQLWKSFGYFCFFKKFLETFIDSEMEGYNKQKRKKKKG